MSNHLNLIARFEGYRAEPYWDYHQWSIGYGSYAGSRDRSQRPNITVSEAEARQMLARQVRTYEANVDRYDRIYNWTPNERAAMISFAYNIGSIDQLTANGTRSKEEIARMMLQYNKAGGQRLQGLVDRRNQEYQVFTGGAPIPPGPTGVVGVGGAEAAGVSSDVANGSAGFTGDFQSANNMADLWSIAEQSGNFWDNELDVYDLYTYNLELFCIDQRTTIDFLADNYSLDDVMNDAWPGPDKKRVTIGMTGATTEFNIQDLNVESLGYGSGNNARMSGTAVRLNFSIVQVGNTSLNDSLQNAAIMCGFTSIHDATWYMKIKFIGYINDQPESILATKVLPFKISNFRDLNTSTDARGTATVLEGTIIQNTVFDSTVNVIEHTFTFDIAETLRETLDNFITRLNERVEENNFAGDNKFINTYEIAVDPDFEEQFMGSAMNGPTPNLSGATNTPASRQNGLNISQQAGTVPTGSNVYEILTDICVQSTNIADQLRETQDGFTSSFNIVPVIVPKEDGLNVITNTRGHRVIYNFGIRRTPIVQNQADLHIKVQNTAKLVDEIFNKGRCRKRYYYQYTGLNDQILDFTVSLNKQLQKAYVAPSDNFIWANFLNSDGADVNSILQTNQRALDAMNTSRGLAEGLNTELQDAQTALDSIRDEAGNIQREIRDSFLSDLRSQGLGGGEAEAIVSQVTEASTIRQLLQDIEEISPGASGRILNGNNRGDRIQDLFDRVEEAEGAVSTLQSRLRSEEAQQDDIMQQAIGGQLSDRISQATGQNVSNAFSQFDDNNDNLILIEELDTDFVSRLTTDEFRGLIDTMRDNPMVFRRVIIPRLLQRQSPGVWRTTDREGIELAREKYYEGLNVDISMQNLTITIKGDPFWLNNYITPMKATELFGDSATLDQYRNYTIDLNGQNYCMIITNKAAGTDELDNIKVANLMIAVYSVRGITSSFSGGIFTQSLDMIKMPFPADFKSLNPTIDATFEALEAFGGSGDELAGLGQRPGTNFGASTDGGDGDGIGGTNIAAPIGAGTALVGGNGTGDGELQPDDGPGGSNANIVVVDPTATYGPANGALLNALTNAFNTSNGFPTVAGAVQLAYALNQMRGLCDNGVQAACSSVALAEQEIIRGYQIDPEQTTSSYVQELNEVILEDPDFVITPEGIAILNQALINQGREPIDPNDIAGLNVEQLESFNEAIELDMQRYYVGTDDIISDNTAPMISLDPSQPGGAFAQNNAETLLNSTDPFDPRESSFNSYASATGMPDRSISTQIPPNTLTPIEMERATAIQKELETMIRETPLTSMSDTEFARAKQLEQALEGIVENATTGTRGEIRDEVIQREKRSELTRLENDLAEAQADAEGFHWTTAGALEDAEKRDALKQQVLVAQTENRPIVMEKVQTTINPDSGEVELTPFYRPTPIDGKPIVVPKTDPLPIPSIDNGDGTMTIEGPPVQRPTVTDNGINAIDTTSLSEQQKQEYVDALESNNGTKVKQFIDSLPPEQQNEILQLEQTQELVKLPGSVPAEIPGNAIASESAARQLGAAQGIYDNILNQFESLPLVTKTETLTHPTTGETETFTWEQVDLTKLQPVKYIDSNGVVQTFDPLSSPGLDPDGGWTPSASGALKDGIASNFTNVTSGFKNSDGIEISGAVFGIIEDNEEESQ